MSGASSLPPLDQSAAPCNGIACICKTEKADVHTNTDDFPELPFGCRALVTRDEDDGLLMFEWYTFSGVAPMDDHALQAWFLEHAEELGEHDMDDEEAFDIFRAYKFGVQNVHEVRRSSSPCGGKRKSMSALDRLVARPRPMAPLMQITAPVPSRPAATAGLFSPAGSSAGLLSPAANSAAQPHPMALPMHMAAPVPSHPPSSPAADTGLFSPAANSGGQESPFLPANSSLPTSAMQTGPPAAKPAPAHVSMPAHVPTGAPAATPTGQAPPAAPRPTEMHGAPPASLLFQTASPAAASPAARAAAHVAAKAIGGGGGAAEPSSPLGQMSPATQAAVNLAALAGGGARGGAAAINMAASGVLGVLPTDVFQPPGAGGATQVSASGGGAQGMEYAVGGVFEDTDTQGSVKKRGRPKGSKTDKTKPPSVKGAGVGKKGKVK
ncbi:hypothetical protein T484DRAFT_1919462, partial [Baffinella frigidus]